MFRISSDDELHCTTDMRILTMLPTIWHRKNLACAYCAVLNHTSYSIIKASSQTAFNKYINTSVIYCTCVLLEVMSVHAHTSSLQLLDWFPYNFVLEICNKRDMTSSISFHTATKQPLSYTSSKQFFFNNFA